MSFTGMQRYEHLNRMCVSCIHMKGNVDVVVFVAVRLLNIYHFGPKAFVNAFHKISSIDTT